MHICLVGDEGRGGGCGIHPTCTITADASAVIDHCNMRCTYQKTLLCVFFYNTTFSLFFLFHNPIFTRSSKVNVIFKIIPTNLCVYMQFAYNAY